MTKRYGLIGKNIDYSFSRTYFAEKFEKLKDRKSIYVNFDLQNINEFSKILEDHKDTKGLNVTIPYKQSIIPYLDSLSKKAIAIGAVNTIQINKKGQLKGYNTDWYGFYHSLKPMLKFHHKRALILGTGGASKAIEYALKKLGIKYTFVSRTKEEYNLTYSELTEEVMNHYTIIINTTPVGTFPNIDQMPEVPVHLLSKRHIVYDLIYNPEETTLMKEAKVYGAKVKNGYEMLVLQAEKAYKIWNKPFSGD
ncbi:shikimate dehydrogenase [Myroides odoratimimus]|uniref:Shikimate dehydrogenase n=1 Tax=Myroides odoratimimus TaxID=76832 RepID=A0AAI8C660_9FLAO|nr:MULTISPECIES: shikimate dehydrogenase [Myroides]ALU26754.1 shikimate dehydrogenase [Myroides odoratimimus]APA92774.1 shikimate dehydrogenase [Myroides sp. ZB35]MDM1035245.1 shikimate dehydrogenase [Myroides odoratimimus]MDM1037082.1 shikimate dehydrogenase [Myroides odoratimimus]MDM1051286.1 shikimate dehydrogenase [Myroides odoratimimus]